MVSKRQSQKRGKPATTPENRENQLVSLATDLAEKQIVAGSASSQVITHYLQLGSTREKLEQERLAKENELLQAKVDQMSSAKRIEELYETALNAMRAYGGHDVLDEDEVM